MQSINKTGLTVSSLSFRMSTIMLIDYGIFRISKLILLTLSITIDRMALASGGVAQLARAREWHSRGRGFDSLHLQTGHGRYF